MNKKSIKSLNQYQERNYAPKERKLEKGDLIKHCNRGKSRETSETGCSNILLSGKEEKEITNNSEIPNNSKEDIMPKAKLGSGARFIAVEKSAAKSGAENPAAVAAAAGMKKYGKVKMEKLANAGKKK